MADKRMQLPEAADDPKQFFGTPGAVMEATELSHDEKVAVLERWRLDAIRLSESEAEGMAGGETPLIEEIEQLLLRLKQG